MKLKLSTFLAVLLLSASAFASKGLPIVGFVPNPGTPTVTPTGGAAGSYSYKLVGVDSSGAFTAAGTAGTTAAGPTTLDSTHYNTVTWTDPLNAAFVKVYRTAGGATQGLIATVAAGTQTLADKALLGDSSTPSSTNGTGIGPAIDVSAFGDLTVQIDGTFVATMQIQGRLDGSSGWLNIGTAITTASWLDITATAKSVSHMRVNQTAYTSGTPVASVLGHRAGP